MTTNTLPAKPRTQNHTDPIERARRLGTAAALVAMPAIFVFAFSTHPGLGSIRLLEPADGDPSSCPDGCGCAKHVRQPLPAQRLRRSPGWRHRAAGNGVAA